MMSIQYVITIDELTTSVFSEKTLSKSASGASHFTGKGIF